LEGKVSDPFQPKIARDDKISKPTELKSSFSIFNDLGAFENAIVSEFKVNINFDSVIELSSDFLQSDEDYMVLNVKDNVEQEPNNFLFLTREKAFLYVKKSFPIESAKIYQNVLAQPYGRSTVLAFIVLTKVLNSYKARLESLIVEIKDLENKFDLKRYRNLSLEVERRQDRLEELYDLVLRLQERTYPQVNTEYISFDYRVLIAETNSLYGRFRRRLSLLRDLRQDFETQTTSELNTKIVRLNDVVKKLTAITVILMIPNLIAGHFGMNFEFMPELHVHWAYPAVIGFQFAFMVLAYLWFRRIDWL
jgi:Mg2+ and Co2+ transporter CorA